ncbi:hypothetical protein OROGR_004866 [Orobanche gracilis]
MLPPELLREILSRLPAKSLLRFRCISKSWCRMIDSPDLIKLHLNQSSKSYSNHTLILTETGFNFHMLDLGLLDKPKKAHVSKTPFLCEEIDGISNTCNGLVVITAETFGPLALWNPFLRKNRIFPDSPSKPEDPYHFPNVLYGLGYDSRNDDYKVVRNFECKDIRTHQLVFSKTEVYTFQSNVWKEVQPFPSSLSITSQLWVGQVNGALHMLCTDNSGGSKIVGFSVENEIYFEIIFPLSIRTKNVMGLHLLGDCLSIDIIDKSQINIWVMKEYGVQDSWINLISIANLIRMDHTDSFKPLIYSEDGLKVLLYHNGSKFVWYDLKKKTMEKLEVGGVPFLIDLELCVQSLVFPVGPRGSSEVKKNGQQMKEKKVKQRRDDFLSKGFKLKL